MPDITCDCPKGSGKCYIGRGVAGQGCRIYVRDDPAKAKEESPFTDEQYAAFAADMTVRHPNSVTASVWLGIRKRIDRLEEYRCNHNTRLTNLQDRITKIEDRLDQPPDDPCPPAPPKRIIKGGWVNVYRGDYDIAVVDGKRWANSGDAHLDAIGDTRFRLACIHIQDFTEGEGL